VEEELSKDLLYTSEKITGIHSKLLERDVDVELLLPVGFDSLSKKYPLLLLNDGQDNEKVRILETVDKLTKAGTIQEIIVAAVTAGDRLQEYGVASKLDYKHRGSKAKTYSSYLIEHLIPYLAYRYPIDTTPSVNAIAGYSMGGLSALDIAWNNPEVFKKVGIFSGSLWWRKRDTKSVFYSDQRDRIMHQHIRKGKFKPGMQFWFQTGTEDEYSDRNGNGIIDSIDDTLDLIAELTKKGYRPFKEIQYYEMPGGKHDTETWAQAMPEFLKWAFGK
jgi:enterochelin esterase-like enzyme